MTYNALKRLRLRHARNVVRFLCSDRRWMLCAIAKRLGRKTESLGQSSNAFHRESNIGDELVTLPHTLPHTAEPLVSRIVFVPQCFTRIFGRCRIPDNGRFPHGSRVSGSHDQPSTKPAVASSREPVTRRAPQAPHTPTTKTCCIWFMVVFAINAL